MRRVTIICLFALGASSPLLGQAPERARPSFAFFVIGPDTAAVRTRTADAVIAALRHHPGLDSTDIWAYRAFLASALDATIGDGPFDQPPMNAAGPSEASDAHRRYPWDLTRVLPLHDQRELRRAWGLSSLTQVVLEAKGPRVRLTAIEVVGSDSVVVTHLTAEGSRLRDAATTLAAQMGAAWVTEKQRGMTRTRER